MLSRIKQLLCAMWITFAITGPVRAAFEIVDGGAYAMSMGGPLSAEIGSAETIWFNPAASAKLNVPHATSTYGTLYSGLEDSPVVHTGAIAWPVKSVTLQAGYHTLRLDPWSEMSGLVGVAVVLHPRVSFGGAVRVNAWNSGRYGNQSWLGPVVRGGMDSAVDVYASFTGFGQFDWMVQCRRYRAGNRTTGAFIHRGCTVDCQWQESFS